MSGWSCRYQWNEECRKVGVPCQPGMRGCVLCGRVVFAADVPPRKTSRSQPRQRPAPRKKTS